MVTKASNLEPQNYLNQKILKNLRKIKVSGPGTSKNGLLGPFLPGKCPGGPCGPDAGRAMAPGILRIFLELFELFYNIGE